MTDILLELGIDINRPISREETKQAIEELKKVNLKDMGIKSTISEETVQQFMESKVKLKTILADVAPNIDSDKFITFLMTSPFKVNSQNFDTIIKLMISLDSHLPANTVKGAFADLESVITVNQQQENVTIADSKSYLHFFMNIIFPIFLAILTQYQTYETTEQLKHMQSVQQQELDVQQQQLDVQQQQLEAQQQQTEQLNRIENLLKQQIEQDSQPDVPDFILDLEKY